MSNKPKNIIIFAILIIFTVCGIIYNSSLDLGKDIYVVSPQEGDYSNEDTENKKNDNIKTDEVNNYESQDIKVYISGEVKSPGVVSVSVNDRLIDAVEKLGGLTSNADLNRVNLAVKIEDGNHYIIPKIGDELNISDYNNSTSLEVSNTINNKVNINTANENELESLTGIGEATAKKIIDYRNENGKFSRIEDIKNVKGIGENKFEDIKDSIIAQ